MNLPKDVERYLLSFRATRRSLLKGIMSELHLQGPPDRYGCCRVEYGAIPGCHITFSLRNGRLYCAYVEARGCVIFGPNEDAHQKLCGMLERGILRVDLDAVV